MILSAKALSLGILALASFPIVLQESEERLTQPELERITAEIQAQIEALRGQKFDSPVAVALTDAEGLAAYAKARLELTETEESMHADELAMKHLGLLDGDRNLLEETFAMLEGQVGGFYDPGSDSFYIMDRFSGGLAKIIMSHELTHALDDQLYDIDGTLAKSANSTDAELAYHSVVEGSGLGTMYAWMNAHKGEWTLADVVGAQSMTSGLEDAPAVVWKPQLGSYWLGVAFLGKTDNWLSMQMKAPKVVDVTAAFKNPPRSTEQVLHPHKYWDEAQRDDPVLVEFQFQDLPQGWSVSSEDTLGEILLALITTPAAERESVNPNNPTAVLAMKFTNRAAEGWGGDRMVLLEREGASLLHLVTTWDSVRDAEEFEAAVKVVAEDVAKSKAKGLAEGGFEVERAEGVVRVTSYSGADAAQAAAVLNAISFSTK